MWYCYYLPDGHATLHTPFHSTATWLFCLPPALPPTLSHPHLTPIDLLLLTCGSPVYPHTPHHHLSTTCHHISFLPHCISTLPFDIFWWCLLVYSAACTRCWCRLLAPFCPCCHMLLLTDLPTFYRPGVHCTAPPAYHCTLPFFGSVVILFFCCCFVSAYHFLPLPAMFYYSPTCSQFDGIGTFTTTCPPMCQCTWYSLYQ